MRQEERIRHVVARPAGCDGGVLNGRDPLATAYFSLLVAVIERAVRDVRAGNGHARDALDFLVDVDPGADVVGRIMPRAGVALTQLALPVLGDPRRDRRS